MLKQCSHIRIIPAGRPTPAALSQSAAYRNYHSKLTALLSLPDMGRRIVYCSICGCPFKDISRKSIEGEFLWRALLPDQTKVSHARSLDLEKWLIFLVALF